jgi:hypothetical protein
MKIIKNLICLLLLLTCAITDGQNKSQNDKLSFNSFSITPLEIFFYDNSDGFALSADVSFALRKNIFTFSGAISEEFTIWGRGEKFKQLNFMYGREFELIDWLFIDTHAGLGVFFYNNPNNFKVTKAGVPLLTKLRFKTGDKFSIGLSFQANTNSVKNIYAVGLLLQWNY